MHFSLAAIFAVVLLVASTAHTTHITIPLSRHTNVYRSDGSVDLEALKRETDYSTAKILRGILNYERNTGQRHPLSRSVRDFKRAIASNPLTNFNGQIWWGTVYVGTPPVAFTVDFDTGSCDFIIPGLGCKGCNQGATQYNPGASSTSVALGETFETEYGDGSYVSGPLYNDTVVIVGLAATRQTFGGLVSVIYSGPITWVQLLNQQFWQISFDSLQIGGQVVIGHTPCIIDSGTSLVIGELNQVDQLYSLIPGSRPEADGFYSIPCKANFPDISFYFGGQRFSMTQSFNFGPTYRDSPRCYGGIRGREDTEYWTIGTSFMTNYYSIFDIGEPGVRAPQVGFATLA